MTSLPPTTRGMMRASDTRSRGPFRPRASGRARAFALGALIGLSGALPATAQSGASGSETHLSPTRSLVAAGATSASAGYRAETSLADPTATAVAQSESYRFHGGALWTGNGFDPPGPVAFGFAEPRGPKEGFDTAVVLGLGFLEPGAGATQATLGGSTVEWLAPRSDTELELLTPGGTNLHRNALAGAELTVTNALGTSRVDAAYDYLPALVTGAPPRIGSTLRLTHLGAPGGTSLLVCGQAEHGSAWFVGTFGGSLEVVSGLTVEGGLVPAPFGVGVHELLVPDDAALVGASISWQLATWTAGDEPLAFSNLLTTTITD